MTRPLKWILLLFGAAGLVVLAIIVFLVVDFPGQSTDHVVKRAVSPDGRVVAELHEVVTAMHGGPDLIHLTLSSIAGKDSAIVYSSVFECGPDFSGYELRWQSAHSLSFLYKTCAANPSNTAQGTQLNSWRDVNIHYQRD